MKWNLQLFNKDIIPEFSRKKNELFLITWRTMEQKHIYRILDTINYSEINRFQRILFIFKKILKTVVFQIEPNTGGNMCYIFIIHFIIKDWWSRYNHSKDFISTHFVLIKILLFIDFWIKSRCRSQNEKIHHDEKTDDDSHWLNCTPWYVFWEFLRLFIWTQPAVRYFGLSIKKCRMKRNDYWTKVEIVTKWFSNSILDLNYLGFTYKPT